MVKWLVSLGLSTFPIPRSDGERFDGKLPAIPWRQYQRRRPTDAELTFWFQPNMPMNVAIVTGAVSGVVAVDADNEEALRWCVARLPYTPWQTRTARGWHLFYRHPGIPIRNRARLESLMGRVAVDVRGDGGYVIAPGSVHASGALYQLAGDWSAPCETLPVFDPTWLSRARPELGRPLSPPRPAGDSVERARRYLAAVARPEIGQGSDVATLYVACRLVRGFALSADQAEALLWEWAGDRPGWTQGWIARKVQNAKRYGTEPIGGLA
jgi:hypothetical protein